MDRLQKKEVVASLTEGFSDAGVVIVTHYKGLTASEVMNLRVSMRNAGVVFKVAKNNLSKLALGNTQYASLCELMVGPVAIAYSEDPIAAAKAVVDYANNNEKLIILGGAVGSESVDVSRIKTLAKLPSLDELRSTLIAMISTPATRLACISSAPAAQLARVVSAYSRKEA